MSGEELARVSDTEREAAVVRLRDASAAGRLTLEELSERTGLAYAAGTKAELEHVTADLPNAQPAAPEAQPGIRWIIGIFAPLVRRGRWRVAPRTIALSIFAPASIDLRAATFPHTEATIFVVSIFAPVTVTVPEHIEVDLSVLAVFAPSVERGTPGELPPGAPRLHLKGVSVFGPVFLNYRRS